MDREAGALAPIQLGSARRHRTLRPKLAFAAGCMLIASCSAVAIVRATDPEAAFIRDMSAAMDRMMAEMDPRPAWAKLWPFCGEGTVDAHFVAMMVPHHQGAIDMAIAQLRYGRDPQLKRIAQEIIVSQQQEIAAMRLALGQPLPAPAPAPAAGMALSLSADTTGAGGQ